MQKIALNFMLSKYTYVNRYLRLNTLNKIEKYLCVTLHKNKCLYCKYNKIYKR